MKFFSDSILEVLLLGFLFKIHKFSTITMYLTFILLSVPPPAGETLSLLLFVGGICQRK